MKIVKPSVTLWEQGDNKNNHIARCARVCYASIKEDNCNKLVNNLIIDKHYSMLRHASYYFIIPIISIAYDKISEYLYSPYISIRDNNSFIYMSTNGQFILEQYVLYKEYLEKYQVHENVMRKTQTGMNVIRYSFNVITQISTSRELNRVSPNNIAEQSTRFCNYNRGRFEGECAICQPHWFNLNQQEIAYFKLDDRGQSYFKLDNGEFHHYNNTNIIINKYKDNPKVNIMFQRYMISTYNSCSEYISQVTDGMLPQDARGQLPIDLATECVYTYSIDEWRNILDLRYYGTSGAPHPNAKIIASKIRDILIEQGYGFRN